MTNKETVLASNPTAKAVKTATGYEIVTADGVILDSAASAALAWKGAAFQARN